MLAAVMSSTYLIALLGPGGSERRTFVPCHAAVIASGLRCSRLRFSSGLGHSSTFACSRAPLWLGGRCCRCEDLCWFAFWGEGGMRRLSPPTPPPPPRPLWIGAAGCDCALLRTALAVRSEQGMGHWRPYARVPAGLCQHHSIIARHSSLCDRGRDVLLLVRTFRRDSVTGGGLMEWQPCYRWSSAISDDGQSMEHCALESSLALGAERCAKAYGTLAGSL